VSQYLESLKWRCELCRVWLDDGLGYRLDYQINGRVACLAVVRLGDGFIVARHRCPRDLFVVLPYERILEVAMGFLQRAAAKDAKGLGAVSKDGTKFAERLPALGEYLTSDKWENGDARVTSTLLVFQEDGVWKCCLNDRDQLRTLWVSGASMLDVLDALESLLASGEGEWRASTQFKTRKPPKRS